MTAIVAQLGAILLQAGAFAALIVVAPVLYGLVVVWKRWWLVTSAALLLVGGIGWFATHEEFARAAAGMPAGMQPEISSYVAVALAYVALAALVRLSTLRLEWRGWERRTVKDIHVLAFLAPTVAAVWLAVNPAL